MKKLYCVICGKYRKIEKPKMPYFFEKKNICSFYYLHYFHKRRMKMKKYLRKKNQLKY